MSAIEKARISPRFSKKGTVFFVCYVKFPGKKTTLVKRDVWFDMLKKGEIDKAYVTSYCQQWLDKNGYSDGNDEGGGE